VRQIHYVLDIPLGTAFQFSQGQVVSFQRPKVDVLPIGKNSNQPSLIAVRVVCHLNIVDADSVLPLELRASTCNLGNLFDGLFWNNAENIQVGGFSAESIMLADNESTDTVEVDLGAQNAI
jgi:hypothetical protein